MAYVVLENFKQGLDARRSILTSVPGALLKCNNAHVNEGGEIEKRQAFFRTALPAGTFGLEATDQGLVTFGSGPTPDMTGTGVTYQRIQHPTDLDNGTALRSLTKVVFSRTFKGKAFVVALFDDGRVFLYWNGVLIDQSRNGRVMNNAIDLSLLGADLKRELLQNVPAWTVDANVDGVGNVVAGLDQVFSPTGLGFSVVPTDSHTPVQLAATDNGGPSPGTAGTQAWATFQVVYAGGRSFTVQAPTSPTDATLINLCTNVASITDSNTTAQAVVNAINARTVVTGYTATVNTNSVNVFAPISFGVFVANLVVTSSDGGGLPGGGAGPGPLQGTVSPAFLFGGETTSIRGLASKMITTSGAASVLATGGTAPYTYAWAEESTGAGNGIIPVTANASVTKFQKVVAVNTMVTGRFICTITDNATNHFTTTAVNVTLEFDFDSGL